MPDTHKMGELESHLATMDSNVLYQLRLIAKEYS